MCFEAYLAMIVVVTCLRQCPDYNPRSSVEEGAGFATPCKAMQLHVLRTHALSLTAQAKLRSVSVCATLSTSVHYDIYMIQSFLSPFHDCQHHAMDESIVSQVASSGSCPACHLDLTCQLCHDLRVCGPARIIRGQSYLAHQTWLSALRAQSCRRCQIVLKAFEKTDHRVLDEYGEYSGGRIVIYARPNGLVRIEYTDNRRQITAAELQIYSPKGTKIRCSSSKLS